MCWGDTPTAHAPGSPLDTQANCPWTKGFPCTFHSGQWPTHILSLSRWGCGPDPRVTCSWEAQNRQQLPGREASPITHSRNRTHRTYLQPAMPIGESSTVGVHGASRELEPGHRPRGCRSPASPQPRCSEPRLWAFCPPISSNRSCCPVPCPLRAHPAPHFCDPLPFPPAAGHWCGWPSLGSLHRAPGTLGHVQRHLMLSW